ncbi:uncharacterized protein LOC119183795 isoform X2 [Rhipicephalus microplus]|uniref:uncharacterized protein LOC119183795 isoform X2 n=1 Tax=Rhipicephalus microplus TaxID=6941 RepID=UPI003F6B9D53
MRNAWDIVMHDRELNHEVPRLRTCAFFAKRLPVVSCCHPRPLWNRYRSHVDEASVLCCFKAGTCIQLQLLSLSYATHLRLLTGYFGGQPRAFMRGFLPDPMMTRSFLGTMCGWLATTRRVEYHMTRSRKPPHYGARSAMNFQKIRMPTPH